MNIITITFDYYWYGAIKPISLEVKMKYARKIWTGMLLAAFLLSACAGQVPPSPTMDVNAIMTQNVGTIVAQFFQTQTAMYTPATPTPLDTPTFIPTNTPMASPSALPTATFVYSSTIVYPTITATGTQYTATPNPSTLGYGCNNLTLIRDETIPAGTEMQPGEHFTKTWKVSNTGTCDWLYGYAIVYVSGSQLAEDAVRLGKKIEPGKWTQISIEVTAPDDPGTYVGYWKLSDGAGHVFGSLLGISIVVKSSYP